MLNDTNQELKNLWVGLDAVIQATCANRDLQLIRSEIEALRNHYRMPQTFGAPSFGSIETRLAYAVAYHAPHAYSYLELFSRQQFGPKLFASMHRPLNVLVLGAGIGAETLAMLRWLRAENCKWFRGSQLTLVDRARWADTRRLILQPMIRDSRRFFDLGIRQVLTDLSTPEGNEKLKELVPAADLILAPSLVTELITEHSEEQLHVCLRNFMKPNSRLLLIDHGKAEFRHVASRWSHDFKEAPNATSQCQVAIPRPSAWITKNLLIGTSGLIPNRHYELSWYLLER